jgi:uncharacterized membrane protein
MHVFLVCIINCVFLFVEKLLKEEGNYIWFLNTLKR